jgi:hypothetical protein
MAWVGKVFNPRREALPQNPLAHEAESVR